MPARCALFTCCSARADRRRAALLQAVQSARLSAAGAASFPPLSTLRSEKPPSFPPPSWWVRTRSPSSVGPGPPSLTAGAADSPRAPSVFPFTRLLRMSSRRLWRRLGRPTPSRRAPGPRGRSSPFFSLAPHLTRRRVALEISKEGTSWEEGTGFLF
ncbi:hypothetical protein MC885_009604 [Smutsia gigantea]|nr:hypothetical protein MC885_009604 [Smutsia gigantea]